MRLLLAALAFLLAAPSFAEVRVTPKHLLIVRPGIDAVWGSYVFAVQNDGEAEAPFKARIMLPKETIDFMPQEGVEASQVTLAEGGTNKVQIEASFPNGVHIVSIGFKVDARFGKADLTLMPEEEVGSLTVLTPRGSPATVVGPDLMSGEDASSPDPQYAGQITQRPLPAGTAYILKVDGVPEGRTRLWFAGGAVALALVLLGLVMAWRTKPHVKEDGGEASLVV